MASQFIPGGIAVIAPICDHDVQASVGSTVGTIQPNAPEFKREVSDIEKQVGKLIERVVDTDNATIAAAYEKKITQLEREKLVAIDKIQNNGKPRHTFDEMFELAMGFLSSHWKIWASGKLDLQRLVLKLVFLEPIPYSRNHGFLNSKLSLPINMLVGNLGLGLQNGAAGEI